MKTLESCYEYEFHKLNFLERKLKITHPKTILLGPPKCGKSYLIYDYLSTYETQDHLYIDLNDLKNDKDEVISNLKVFVHSNNIKVLVIENYEFDFDLPICESIILTTSMAKSLVGFKKLYMQALDFEEYILHDNKHQNITNSFNSYFKYGNLPEIISYDESDKPRRSQEVLRLFCKDNTELRILQLLFSNIDEKKSIYQLFSTLKKRIKISKDKFYETCKIYEENKIIFFLEKFNQEKAVKKLYSYNHGFVNSISHTKKFKHEFTNMVFLELQNKFKEIYYLDNVDFYIPKSNSIILSIPFFNDFILNTITKKLLNSILEYEISNITIVTISNAQVLFLEDLEVQILPFYEWALS